MRNVLKRLHPITRQPSRFLKAFASPACLNGKGAMATMGETGYDSGPEGTVHASGGGG
jgi:hypothetical protein